MSDAATARLLSAFSARSRFWCTLGLCAALGGVYLPSFSVPFLMDDVPSIVDNPTIRSLGSAWRPPTDSGLTVSGRPLLNATLALNYLVSGTETWSYHAFNLLLHATSAILLFHVVRLTLERPRLAERFGASATTPIAFSIALLWAVHPLQTESVTYVIQRAECLVGLMYLLTLYCFIRATKTPDLRRWRVAAVLACLAGMASKEVMATAPILLLLYDRTFVAGSWSEVRQSRGGLHASLCATWIVLAVLIANSGARGGTVGFDSTISPGHYALTQTYAIVTYLRLAFWPAGLVFDYGVPQALEFSEIAPEFTGFVLLLATSAIAMWRAPSAGFCLAFFLLVLAPTSSVVPVVTQTMTEHRMYLPLAGVVALAVGMIYRLLPRQAFLIVGVAALLLGAASYQRNRLYQSDLALWEDTARKRPDNLRAHLNIGLIHFRAGRYNEAAAAYERVLALDPNMAEAANNLGNSLQRLGRMAEAARFLERALTGLAGRERAVALSNLGSVLLQAGDPEAALARLREAVQLDPSFPEAHYNLANVLLQSGQPAAALTHYEAALQARTGDAEIRSNYANALMELGRQADAIRELELVVHALPNSAEAHNNLGVALALAGRPAEARGYFQRAVELAPTFQPARENLARAERALARP